MEPAKQDSSGRHWANGLGMALAISAAQIGAAIGRHFGGEVGKWIGVILSGALAIAVFVWMMRRYGEAETGKIILALVLFVMLPIMAIALSLHWAGFDF